jgi:hypothetical protein
MLRNPTCESLHVKGVNICRGIIHLLKTLKATFTPVTQNPGSDTTVWVNSSDNTLYIGNKKIQNTFPDGTTYSSYLYWDDSDSSWKIADDTIRLGNGSGQINQGDAAVAIGVYAGREDQGLESIAIGSGTASKNQGNRAVSIGTTAGSIDQKNKSIAIGSRAANSGQFKSAIAIGELASSGGQKSRSIAIGDKSSSKSIQQEDSIAIGSSACSGDGIHSGQEQKAFSIAIGVEAGKINQQENAVAIGYQAAQTTQGMNSIAIGYQAGCLNQQPSCVAIGQEAGKNNQGMVMEGNSIAIGYQAAQTDQGSSSVAIGYEAGKSNQSQNSIVLNAANSPDIGTGTQEGFYISPIRDTDVITGLQGLQYNDTLNSPTLYEITSFAAS